MATKKNSNKSSWQDVVSDWLVSIIIAVALAFCIRTFLIEHFVVEGNSMHPFLKNQEHLMVDKLTSFIGKPERGEIIIFRYPKDETREFVKRVIAVEGDTIEMKSGAVIVNGKQLHENYIWKDDPKGKNLTNYRKTTVPKGTVFVLGDNRNGSLDSRYAEVGFVPYRLINGRPLFCFYPFGNIRLIKGDKGDK